MGKILEAYLKKYGGEEKTAAPADVNAVFASLFGEEKTASDESVKTAAVYEELGRRLAREAFASDSVEKVAAEGSDEVSSDELQKAAAEIVNELLSGTEKTAAEGDEFDQLFGTAVAEDEVKTAAQAEVIEGIIKGACAGNAQAVALFSELCKVAAVGTYGEAVYSPSLRSKIVGVLKSLAEKTKGGYAAVRAALSTGMAHVQGKAKGAYRAVAGTPARSMGGELMGGRKGGLVGAIKKNPKTSAGIAAGALGAGALGAYAMSRRGKE
jgi:hypothetical protein